MVPVRQRGPSPHISPTINRGPREFAQMSWHKCHDFPVDNQAMNTSGFWWWGCRVVDSVKVMGSGGSSQAHKSFWVAELIHTIILLSVHVCTYLYYSVVFFEPVPLIAFASSPTVSGCRLCPRASAYLWCGCTMLHLSRTTFWPTWRGSQTCCVSKYCWGAHGYRGQSDVGRLFVHLEFI